MVTIEKITAVRKVLNQTQHELADGIGVTQAQLSRYENTTNDIGQKPLQRIFAFWRITEAEFHALTIIALCEIITQRHKMPHP